MPRGPRERPKKLGDKLRQIRLNFGYTQTEMITALKAEDRIDRSMISAWERGTKEPTLSMLLKYARVASISTDSLIDDAVKLKLR